MKTFEIGGYKQIVNKGDISCSCKFSTIHPYNFKQGNQICRHIKELLKILNGNRKLQNKKLR